MATKNKDATTTVGPGPDVSQLRSPIQISGKPIEQVLKSVHYGSPELRCLLLDECDLIFECKVCRALFRDVPNFISHKRVYCLKSSLEDKHVTIANLPDEKVVVIQPQAPEDEQPSQPVAPAQKNARPSLNDTIQRIQSGELGKSEAYKVYTEAADKLQRQKEAMKIATIRTTPIPTNKNAVFIEVNTTSVNIHERQQQQSALNTASLGSDSGRSDALGAARMKRITCSSPGPSQKHLRKPNRQQKHATEPQKLLLEQLKEIQHKVKQKSQEIFDKSAKPKISSQENSVSTAKTKTANCNDENANREESSEISVNIKDKMQPKDSEDLSNLARQNFLSLLAKEETRAGTEKEKSEGKKGAVITRRKNIKVWQDVSKQSATEAAKLIVKSTSRDKRMKNSLTCIKCSSIFSSSKSLGFHTKIHHSPKRTVYQCPYCPSNFYYFFGITRHLFNNHAKTAQEVDAMRAQLRDKAVVMPAPPPKQKKDIFEMQSSRRRAQQRVEDCDGENPMSRKRGKSYEVKMSGRAVKPEDMNPIETQQAKENKRGPRKDLAAETIVLNDSSDKEENSTPSTNTNIKEASPQSSNQSNTPKAMFHDRCKLGKICPKCNRTFSRPKNYEKHIKVCQNEKGPSNDATNKSVTPTKHSNNNTVNQVEDNVDDPKLLALKNKLLSSTFGLTRMVDVRSVATKGKGMETTDETSPLSTNVTGSQILKEMLLATICEEKSKAKELSNENVEARKSKNSPNQNRRSVSADRDVTRFSRNPKSDIEKGKRDSSAESIQSNTDGRPARSRRAVPSKYAVIPTSKQVSPQKSETGKTEGVGGAKSNLESAVPSLPKLQKRPETGDTNITVSQHVIPPLPKLQKRPDLDDSIEPDTKSSPQIIKVPLPKLFKMPVGDDPILVSDVSDLADSPSPEDGAKIRTDDDSFLSVAKTDEMQAIPAKKRAYKGEPKHKQGLPQKTYFSPRIPSGSGSPTLSPVKYLPIRKISSPKKGNILATSQRRSMSSINSLQKTNSNVQTFVDVPLKSAEIEIESKKDETPESQPISPGSVTPNAGCNIVQPLGKEISDNCSYAAKKEELEAVSIGSDDRFFGKGTKVSPPLPVSALSERPKRKRKVPSRNIDAQEMLTKIHNREADIPSKKAKLSETKSSKPSGSKHVEMKQTQDSEIASTSRSVKKNKGDNSLSDNEEEEDDVDTMESVRGKGRVVSNRIYVLNERKSKVQKLKCYDQTRVGKYIDLQTMSCMQCGESCASISNLRRHVIRQHLKWSRFKCKLCKFESYDRSECTTHLYRTHKKIASHNFTSRRSLNALIIDLVKQGLQARSMKKTRTLQGKQQQSQSEGNIYVRPNVRKVPRLPERAAAIAVSNTKNNLPQTSLTNDDSRQFHKSVSSHSSVNPSEAWFKVSPSGEVKKMLPESTSVRNSRKSDTSTTSVAPSGTKKEVWFKVMPTGKLKKILPFNISTRNSPRNFDISPYRQGFIARSEELTLQTRKGKYSKPINRSPVSTSSFKKGTETTIVSPRLNESLSPSDARHIIEKKTAVPVKLPVCLKKVRNSDDGGSDVKLMKGNGSVESEPSGSSKTVLPVAIRGQLSPGELTANPTPQKGSVKYIITTTGSSRIVDKSPKTQNVIVNPVIHKLRDIMTDSSPTMSEQLAKSLMKLKKLGDSMNTSSASTKSTPTTSVTTSGGSSSAQTTPNSATSTGSGQKVPVSLIGKTELSQGKSQSSALSVPLSLPSGSSPSSFVLTRGSSGKIIVYTHSTDDCPTTTTSSSVPLKSIVPASLTTSKITVKSQDAGTKAGGRTKSDQDSLPSGTFVIQQHFL